MKVLGLATLLAVATLVPLAAAEPSTVADPILSEDRSGSSFGQQAPPPPAEPDKVVQDLQDGLGGSQPAPPVAPAPPGSDRGLERIGDEVGQVLSMNWAVTGLVTLSILGTALAGWLLASRYVDPRVALQSPERSMLYGFVKGNPGVHLKQLSSEFTMKTSTVLWHVRKLEAAELIRSKKANGYRVFYPVSGGLEASQVSEAVTALSNVNARQIFQFLHERPMVHPRALTDTLAINAGTVRWHLKKLVKAGLLQEVGERRSLTFHATELGLKAYRQVAGLPTPMEVVAVPSTATTSERQVAEVLAP